ncbi:MAG: polyphosphate polymerase domain-containing protein [Desulfovibrio sp.]|nr:polyphosphate polymerase domain-containing protein [Desulfovibrio sp.]
MQNVQFRNERKYYLTSCMAAVLRRRVACLMRADAHASGPYKISSLYFDDVYDTALREKLSGVAVRDKWRLRWYNDCLDYIHLERKHKEQDLGCKSHACVTETQYLRFLHGDMTAAEELPGEVGRAFCAVHRTRRMRPVVVVSYLREAFGYDSGNVRITFDANVRAARPGALVSLPVAMDGLTILELKYDNLLPTVVADLLCGVLHTQLALSKYVMARFALMQAGYE